MLSSMADRSKRVIMLNIFQALAKPDANTIVIILTN